MSDEITMYDVLFASTSDTNPCLVHQDHVGNNRFEIFLGLNHEAYQQARASKNIDECDRIVDYIIDIVSSKCAPNGRFLERIVSQKEDAPRWKDLGTGDAVRARVHHLLHNFGNPDSSRESSSDDFSSMTHESSSEDHIDFDSDARRRIGAPPKKLRRSVSDSTVIVPSAKVRPRRHRKSESNITDGLDGPRESFPDFDTVTSPIELSSTTDFPVPDNSMDVVFVNRHGNIVLSPSTHVGNNRFRVSMEMHGRNFAGATVNKQIKIIEDFIHTVTKHWRGTFRIVSPNSYLELPFDQVKEMVKSILQNAMSIVHQDSVQGPALNACVPTPDSFLSDSVLSSDAMRSAAIKNLKARREKKEISKRLGARRSSDPGV